MRIYNLTDKCEQSELVKDDDNQYFILATKEEFGGVQQQLDIQPRPQMMFENIDENIRFESYPDFDFLSFVYFSFEQHDFAFEIFNLYLTKRYIVVVVEREDGPHNQFMEDFKPENLSSTPPYASLTYSYYKFLNNAFTHMFESMCRYENAMSSMENEILLQHKDFDFERIVTMKNSSFQVKKCLRLLLYVGDQLMVNDNRLIPQSELRYFRNIDMRINRMYEYGNNLHEVSEHLMALYNSEVNSRTNDLINKLTIFTVFATPITVLTGLYGMNFVNMPELQHQYGYFILLGVIAAILLTTYLILKKIKLL